MALVDRFETDEPRHLRLARKPPDISGHNVLSNPNVSREVSGHAAVRADELRLKLGTRAWFVWLQLCALREPRTGECITTAEYLAGGGRGYRKAGVSSVVNALGRLRDAGLVEVISKRWTNAHTSRVRSSVVRVVYGDPPFTNVSELCVVPEGTKEWMMQKKTRGGWRPGAGRKKKVTACAEQLDLSVPCDTRDTDVQTARKESNEGGAQGQKESNDPSLLAPQKRIKTCGDSGGSKESKRVTSDLSSVYAYGDQDFSFSKEKESRAEATRRSISFLESEKATVELAARDGEQADLGLELAGTATVRRSFEHKHPAACGQPHPAVPDLVRSVHVLAPILLPGPPLLVAGDTAERWAHQLLVWYIGCVVKHTGARPFNVRHDRPASEQPKIYGVLVKAAQAFIAHDIPPAAWIAWSFDAWKHIARESPKLSKSKWPPIAMVFSVARIEEHLSWFSSEERHYSSVRVMYTPSGRELMRKQNELRDRLGYSDTTDAEVSRIASEIFPGTSHAALVARVVADAANMNADLRRRAMRGDWLWD